jgi:hypothetical protein
MVRSAASRSACYTESDARFEEERGVFDKHVLAAATRPWEANGVGQHGATRRTRAIERTMTAEDCGAEGLHKARDGEER